MIARVQGAEENPQGKAADAWEAFAQSQQSAQVTGWVTQPAHARLAGQLAAALEDNVFGALPGEVLETIARHDLGWSAADLRALEPAGSVGSADESTPKSFLDIAPSDAVQAWGASVRAAEARSALAGVLTGRHFCLLAPKDGDPAHHAFVQEETARRAELESSCQVAPEVMARYVAALGFCDTLSLLLCSGIEGEIKLPLAHPADPAAQQAEHLTVAVHWGKLTCDRPVLRSGSRFRVGTWTLSEEGTLSSARLSWRVA